MFDYSAPLSSGEVSSLTVVSLSSLADISATKVVTAGLSIADKDTNPRAIGILKNAVMTGELGNVVIDGEFDDSSFSFTVGQPVFLGSNGGLTQTPPTSGWLVVVGTAIKTTALKLELQSTKVQLA